jgi:hypothetical protein
VAIQQSAPLSAATVRGRLRQMVAWNGAEFALALVGRDGEDGTPMRITRGNYDQLIKNGMEQSVVCRCDGHGLWFLQLERPPR